MRRSCSGGRGISVAWRLHHVNIPAHDVREAVGFYERVFGMKESTPPWKPQDRGVFGVSKDDVGWFDDGRAQVHISRPDARLPCDNGFHLHPTLRGHVAVEVDDVDLVQARLTERNANVAVAGNWALRGVRQLYTYDPGLNVVEILSRPDSGEETQR